MKDILLYSFSLGEFLSKDKIFPLQKNCPVFSDKLFKHVQERCRRYQRQFLCVNGIFNA